MKLTLTILAIMYSINCAAQDSIEDSLKLQSDGIYITYGIDTSVTGVYRTSNSAVNPNDSLYRILDSVWANGGGLIYLIPGTYDTSHSLKVYKKTAPKKSYTLWYIVAGLFIFMVYMIVEVIRCEIKTIKQFKNYK